MKHFLSLSFITIVIGIPALCYAFLDQLYIRRFDDFGHKWLARESFHLTTRDQTLEEILSRYENVILASDDLKGFTVIPAENAHFTASPVYVKRVGFLDYQTMVLADAQSAKAVVFDFQDDTAVFDLLIFVFAVFVCLTIALLSRAKLTRLQEQAVQQTTLRTIQGLAHDFRAPFGKLRIFMSQLPVGSAQTPALEQNRRALDAAINHADDILTDFLSLESVEGALPFDCSQLLHRLEENYFATAKQDFPDIRLTLLAPARTLALGSERKTLRILFNLVDNALKHARSRVDVNIESKSQQLNFSVTNDGETIASEQIESLFKPFYSKRKGGLGLGLFICDSFVKGQGSKLVCHSESGITTFSFSLPQALSSKSAKEATQQTVSSQYNVAYVDDEAFYRNSLEAAVKESAVSLNCFEDTDSFLLALKNEPTRFDLILIDRYGPSFDAVEDQFAASCRDYGFKGPIALYSNSVTNDTIMSGFDKVLDKTKPLHADEIINIIKDSR